MGYMSTDFPGFTPAQSDLLNHWRAQHQQGVPPTREQLDPGAIRAHLSEVSIVEVSTRGHARFRLVGSGLRKVFGCDMRGKYLAELGRETYEVWSLGLASALGHERPAGGLIERDDETHAWLRLPLRKNATGALVLCHDSLIPNARLRTEYDSEYNTSAIPPHNLAA